MPWHRQIGRGSALACLSRKSRSLFARGDGDLPLPKLVKSTMLTAKSPISSECRVKQVDRFIETARALECDEDKERFEAKLGKIAKATPGKPALKRKTGGSK